MISVTVGTVNLS